MILLNSQLILMTRTHKSPQLTGRNHVKNNVVSKKTFCVLTLSFQSFQTMQAIPKDLADLLSSQHFTNWEPKFRAYLAKLDTKAGRQKPWRVNLFNFLLLCREIKMLQNKEISLRDKRSRTSGRSPLHSASAELQNVCNERDAKFAKLREVYFNEDADEKIGLTDSGLWQRLASFRSVHHNKAWSDVPTSQKLSSEVESDEDVTTVYSRGDEIYEVVMQAHSDPNVWPRLNKLCDNFLKQTSVPTMAVILSIL